jgi:hypothetical protein
VVVFVDWDCDCCGYCRYYCYCYGAEESGCPECSEEEEGYYVVKDVRGPWEWVVGMVIREEMGKQICLQPEDFDYDLCLDKFKEYVFLRYQGVMFKICSVLSIGFHRLRVVRFCAEKSTEVNSL